MNAKEIMKRLKNEGWEVDRINGSHHIFVKEGYRPVPVPVHGNRDLPTGLLAAIERQTGVKLRNE